MPQSSTIGFQIDEQPLHGLHPPVRRYRMPGCTPEIFVEDWYASKHFDADSTNNAKPEHLLELALRLPNRRILGNIILVSDGKQRPAQSDENLHKCSWYRAGEGVFIDCSLNAKREALASDLMHNWAHAAHFDCQWEFYMFGLAWSIARSERQLPKYAENNGDAWAVELGDYLCGEDEKQFADYVDQEPLRAYVLQQALNKSLQQAFDEKSVIADKFEARIKAVQEKARTATITSLQKLSTHSEPDTATRALILLLQFTSTEEDLQVVAGAQSLSFAHQQISERELAKLSFLKKLHSLDVSHTYTADHGFEFLENHPELRKLNVEGTRFRNYAIPFLGHLSHLEELNLAGTSIDDGGLNSLCELGLRSLKVLNVSRTGVTAGGIANAQSRLPGCKILS